ncbi:hypothetical protein BCON_0037g00410 [Botryotinia convoluta]|uniref:Uncharacterized protein n=1 Tax=Botryotinia convoluta TaxID=54673 RepID=A0A4Z1IF25_9HELO|nr:hypothetical protein BCON_0037g00410 [Botryotinia convoluta]
MNKKYLQAIWSSLWVCKRYSGVFGVVNREEGSSKRSGGGIFELATPARYGRQDTSEIWRTV